METREQLRVGVYQHYKGNRYLVLGIARDDRDETLLVLYCRLYPRDGIPISARPLASFLEDVETGDGFVPRFEFIGLKDRA